MLPALTLGIGSLHIADDGLPTVVHMDVVDVDKLLTAVTQASKNLRLHHIRSEQTTRSRCVRRNSALRSEATVELAEYGHRCRMRTGHLDGERSFDFIFRPGARDHREGGIHGCFHRARLPGSRR